jgi:5'-nucleotidase
MGSEEHFVLGVDLDGVCADYESAFRNVVSLETGVDVSELPPQNHWDFKDSGWPIRDEEHYKALHQSAVTKYHMFASMPVIEGASDALWRLSDLGVHMRVITHRLYVSWEHATAVSDTVAWLNQPRSDLRPLIPYRDLCFMGDKTDIGADLYIDDSPPNIEAMRRVRADVICFDHLYNKDLPGLRAYGWDDVEKIVMSRLSDRGML